MCTRVEIVCGENEVISIDTAIYGRSDSTTCLGEDEDANELRCQDDMTWLFRDQCDDQRRCGFDFDIFESAEKCYHVNPYVTYSYDCVSEY